MAKLPILKKSSDNPNSSYQSSQPSQGGKFPFESGASRSIRPVSPIKSDSMGKAMLETFSTTVLCEVSVLTCGKFGKMYLGPALLLSLDFAFSREVGVLLHSHLSRSCLHLPHIERCSSHLTFLIQQVTHPMGYHVSFRL